MVVNRKKVTKISILTQKKPTVFKAGLLYSFVMSWKQMKSYYGNLCCVCHKNIYAGSPIFWNNDGSSRVKHFDCTSNTRGATAITVPEESVDSSEFSSELFPISTEEEIERNMGNKNFRPKKKEREFSEEEESL